MLRMVLAGLLIPLGVGVLAAMELRTPPRIAVAVVQPLAETAVGISDSHGALVKADRLEVNYAKSGMSAQPALIDERISSSEATAIGSSKDAIIKSHRHAPKSKKVTTAAVPRSKPKSTDIKRTTIPERTRAASDTGPCRLSAFGGLRKALNSGGCEI